ncbi:MAG: glycoside hydrolase family 15 protein [Methanothrix sp.]|nr:glycoside hydrolase family 15 protein [Methanothrix sp.]
MPRETIVGNGRIAVGFDNTMNVRDFFYPSVGLENHLIGHYLRMGLWVDGSFRWSDNGWNMEMGYMPETLVGRCRSRIPELEISLETNDCVHNSLDVFLRKVEVHNLSKRPRKTRLFFAHDFHIYGDSVGDTVMYEPSNGSIIHYKRNRYFSLCGITSQNRGIHQFAAGYKEQPGREGTWRDAEDGLLEGNPIAQGSVDSAISFELDLQPHSQGVIYYWIACAKSLKQAMDLDILVKKIGVEQLLLETENYWAAWVNKKDVMLCNLPRNILRAYRNSLLIMRAHADSQGGIIASCDSDILQFSRDTYSYVWMRDGAVACLAFDLAGFPEVSRRFFQVCDRVMTDEGFFHHKYSPDGSVGSSWLAAPGEGGMAIEEDETALVLYALWRHFQKYRDMEFIQEVYPNLVLKATDFLLNYIDHETGLPKPSFDLWEEKYGIFTWTAATVYAGLLAGAEFAKVFYNRERHDTLQDASSRLKEAMLKQFYDPERRRFVKALYPDGSRDLSVDSSTSAVFLYGGFDASEKIVEETMNSIFDRLWIGRGVGGLARYENDEYQRISKDVTGNPWFISTLWLARWHIARAKSMLNLKDGMDLLSWVISHSLPSGVMPEQIHPFTGEPVSVSPLVWSHAELVISICEYLNKHQEISNRLIESSKGV